MKKAITIIIIFSLIALNSTIELKSQENEWEKSSHSISVSGSSLLLIATPINLSYNYLKHEKRFHYGITTGLSLGFYEIVDYSSLGVHAAFAMFFGEKSSHFDTKIGLSYSPIILYSRNGWTDYAYEFVPVISLGYRYQKPDSDNYWRIFIGTGGLGFGVGKNINNKKN